MRVANQVAGVNRSRAFNYKVRSWLQQSNLLDVFDDSVVENEDRDETNVFEKDEIVKWMDMDAEI